jgi:hypothetical protein
MTKNRASPCIKGVLDKNLQTEQEKVLKKTTVKGSKNQGNS